MKHIKLLILTLTFTLALSSCAGIPLTQEQVAKLDFGPEPKNYEQMAKDYYTNILKDPESARFKDFSKPAKGYSQSMMGTHAGYLVTFEVNAKNSYGGYTGFQSHNVIINGDRVIGEAMPSAWGGDGFAWTEVETGRATASKK